MSKETTAIKYNGDPNEFDSFWNKLINICRSKGGKNYVLNQDAIAAIMAEILVPELPAGPNAEVRRFQASIAMTQYQQLTSQRIKNISNIAPDSQVVISILNDLLDENLKSAISTFIDGNPLDPLLGLTQALNYLKHNYGPTNQTDVARIQQLLADADDKEGYSNLFTKYQLWQQQLTSINRLDPITDLPVGNQAYSLEQMTTILLRVLKKSTFPAAKALHDQAIQQPTVFTFTELKTRIQNAIKSDLTSFDRSLISDATSTAQVAFNANVTCHNCGRDGHYAGECRSTTCGDCGQTFPSAFERKTHYIEAHSTRPGRHLDYDSRTKAGRKYAAEESYHPSMQSHSHRQIKETNASRRDRRRSPSRDYSHRSSSRDYDRSDPPTFRDQTPDRTRDRSRDRDSSPRGADRSRREPPQGSRYNDRNRHRDSSPHPNRSVHFEANHANSSFPEFSRVPNDQYENYLANRFISSTRHDADNHSDSN
jgi:hypothetical protein